jgi:hypothetical protein
MHNQNQTPQVQAKTQPESAAALVLRIGRNLQRAAESESLATALPILRRLLATATLTAISLPELQRNRDIIQRKHVLRMLAVEAGFKSWEDYRHALENMSADEVGHYDQLHRIAGYPNVWFSTYAEAEHYACEHSGRAVRVGSQAVVLVH